MKEFIFNPPQWMLAVLWLSFAFVVLRSIFKLTIIQKIISACVIVKMYELPIGFGGILGMCLRRIDPVTIVSAQVRATKAELGLSSDCLEAHTLAGGNPGAVVAALALAKKHNMQLEFEEAAAIDLSKKDVVAEIQKTLGLSQASVQDFLKQRKD